MQQPLHHVGICLALEADVEICIPYYSPGARQPVKLEDTLVDRRGLEPRFLTCKASVIPPILAAHVFVGCGTWNRTRLIVINSHAVVTLTPLPQKIVLER